jgi:salicylate hydroxylase
VLLKHLPRSCSKHTSKRLRSYRYLPTGGVELLFEDRTNALCDVLIGADGIKSAVRRTMMAEAAAAARPQDAREFMRAADPVWCGTIAYRAVVPAEKLRAVAPNHRVFEMPTQARNYFCSASVAVDNMLVRHSIWEKIA